MAKIGRNDPCPCGSGKKYKKCCLAFQTFRLEQQNNNHANFKLTEVTPEEMPSLIEAFKRQRSPEPHLDFVRSTKWQGFRWRALYSQLHKRPLKETFHEFIINILKQSFTEEWRKKQIKLPEEKQHVLIKWVNAYRDWRKIHQTKANEEREGVWSAVASGEVRALLQFAYDTYCLMATRMLPDDIMLRLKNNQEFQGARYEIAVAAMMVRAGFTITFLDKEMRGKKHCEFIAKNKYSHEEIGVEAKSRRRRGVLNESGDIQKESLLKGDVYNLLNEALEQAPGNLPFIVFIDLNVLPSPNLPFEQKPWLTDIKEIVSKIAERKKEGNTIDTAVIYTNFSYYYAGNTKEAPPAEILFSISQNPKFPIKTLKILNEIMESVNNYSRVPVEI